MIELSDILSFISFMGILVSIILIVLSKLNYIKLLKNFPTKLLIICVIVFIVGRVGNAYFIEKSSNQVNTSAENTSDKEIYSGGNDDPVVIIAKNFFVDNNDYINCDISVKNNTKYELENLAISLDYTYYNVPSGGGEKHLTSKYTIGHNYTTPFSLYMSKEDDVDQKYGIRNLTKVNFDYCVIKVNGEEKNLSMDELKKLVNSNK